MLYYTQAMWLYLIQGIGYGFSAAAQPGPFQAYIISQTLSRGWERTLPAAFAPLLSDGPIIAVCILLLSQVPGWLQKGLYLAGGFFLLYLAYGAFRALKRFDLNAAPPRGEVRRGVLRAALMNALAPGPYIYWTLVSGPILLRGWRESALNGIGFLGGFYITIVFSLMLIIMVFGTAQKLGPRVNRVLLAISAVALLGFGVFQIWQGIRTP